MLADILRPRSLSRRPAQWIGFSGLALFAVLGPQGPAGALFGLLLLLVATILERREVTWSLVRDPIAWAFGALGVYVFIRAWYASVEFPQTASHQYDAAVDLFIPVALIIFSWWLQADQRRVFVVLLLALCGFCFDLLVELEWSRIYEFLAGRRDGITGTALATALYSGVGLIGLITFAYRYFQWIARLRPFQHFVGSLVFVLILLMLLQVQLVTQSRAVWLTLMVCVPLLALVSLLVCFGRQHSILSFIRHEKRNIGLCSVAGVILLSLIIFKIDTIQLRLSHESESVDQMVQSGFSDIPNSSIGYRVQLTIVGASYLAERPFFGWGPGTSTTKFLLPTTEKEHLAFLSDLHNTYLEIGVRLGFLGFLIYIVIVSLLVREVIRAWYARKIPLDLGLFLLGSALLTASWCLINYRLGNADFLFFLVFMTGIVHTFGQPRPNHENNHPMSSVG